MTRFAALLCGGLFGAGLALSGMSDPAKVIGFLDLFGDWDFALALVMAAALAVTIPGYMLVMKLQHKPLLEEGFSLPTLRTLDKKLIFGALLFGIGWGLYGYCPGPALVSLIYGNLDSVIFVAAMIAGMQIQRLTER